MSNNYNSDQQPYGNGGPPDGNQGPPPSGKLLSNFRQQGQPGPGSQPLSPAPPSGQLQPPSQFSPRLSGQLPSGQFPPPQAGAPMSPGTGQPDWMANAMQTMQRWSGKVKAFPQRSQQPGQANPYQQAGPMNQYQQPGPMNQYQQPGPMNQYQQPGQMNPYQQAGQANSYQQPGPMNQYQQPGQMNQGQPPYTPYGQGQMAPYASPVMLPGEDSLARRWKRSRSTRISMMKRRRRVRWLQNNPRARRIVTSVVISFLVLLIIGFSSGGASAYNFYQAQLPRLHDLSNQRIAQTSYIYDRYGALLYETPAYDTSSDSSKSLSFGGRRIVIKYSQLPDVMKNAQIATEDHTFWDNSGVDPQGILRAASSGGSAGGGSTITQQVIKNLSHDTDHTYTRKMTEAALAIALTQQYPKTKILEMYFNVAGFGAQELGIEAAVEDYFGLKPICKGVSSCTPAIINLDYNQKTKKHEPLLGLARASLLAGMPQDPNHYDPTLGPDNKARMLVRQQAVLHAMMMYNMSVDGLGPVTPELAQKVQVLTSKMTFSPHKTISKYPHFVQWVLGQLYYTLGDGDISLGKQILDTGGFRIRTTIDSHLEDYVELSTRKNIGEIDPSKNVHNAAVVVMDAKNGEVLAMNGSVDYNSTDPAIDGNINMAVSPRSPGSSFKPLVYASAFQMGWYPGIVLPDYKTYFPNNGDTSLATAYHPVDYGNNNGTYHDYASSVRSATANSLNVPAVKAISYAGVNNVTTIVKRMGVTIQRRDQQLSMVLGTAAVPLINMTGAYQVFANNGVRVPPQGILNMWDNYGREFYSYDAQHPAGAQVLSPQIAFMTSTVLTDEENRAMDFGNIHTLSMWDQFPNKDVVAAKTGTTDSFKDNWTIGYTPNVVVGVWAGNTNNTAMQNVIGITGAAPIWHDVIECVTGVACALGTPAKPFKTFPTPTVFAPPPNQIANVPAGFAPPPGVSLEPVSAINGLLGSGQMDWILDAMRPVQAGGVDIQGGGQQPQDGQGTTQGTTPTGTRHHHH